MSLRKYISEFGLNMMGTFRILLQQSDLQMVNDSEIQEKYPFHIYMITRHPRITIDEESINVDEQFLSGKFKIQHQNTFNIEDFNIKNNFGTSEIRCNCPYPHNELLIYDKDNSLFFRGKAPLIRAMFGKTELHLEVLYIGQAYGRQGERTAPVRLLNHSTLQEIYADNMTIAPDKEIWLILWHFEPILLANFDGRHDNYGTTNEEDDEHINNVLRTEITEQQKINYTEAALIRYFEPKYNNKFKYNFPNPAHKTYSECYDIDLNAVCVELQTDDLYCNLESEKVSSNWLHLIQYELHSKEDRISMFDFFVPREKK